MRLSLIMHYDVDENTGEMKYIGQERLTVDTEKATKSSSKKAPAPEIDGPVVLLEANRLVISPQAAEMLQVCEDCRIDVKYKGNANKQVMPIIGTDASFGTKGGNLLSKNGTVSYRGSANAKLAQYGTKFTLTPTENNGLFWLVGDSVPEAPSIPEEVVNIETELDAVNIDNIEDVDLEKFNFKL